MLRDKSIGCIGAGNMGSAIISHLSKNIDRNNISIFDIDEEKIVGVINNLVSNALKYTDSGCIEIISSDKEDFIECVISDTGTGIPEKDIDSVSSASPR